MTWDFAIADPARPHARYRVVDAAGDVIPFVRCCDTLTGDVQRYERRDGRFVVGRDGRVALVRERRPAPLTVSREDPTEET